MLLFFKKNTTQKDNALSHESSKNIMEKSLQFKRVKFSEEELNKSKNSIRSRSALKSHNTIKSKKSINRKNTIKSKKIY